MLMSPAGKNLRHAIRAILTIGVLSFLFASCDRSAPRPASQPQLQRPVAAKTRSPSPPLVATARSQVGQTTIYDPAYVRLDYPGGDVPRERGVCTDVVIRALRDAYKLDLQQLVHEDMKRAFSEYPTTWGLRTPDRNIDHRRVPNLQKYFERKGYSLKVSRRGSDYQPGDLVTCTVPPNRPHIMIVSDRTASNGTPLVIHNIGAGAREENLLFQFSLTGHYRIPEATNTTPAAPTSRAQTNRTIRVFVALADNKAQGIVPVPAKLGNGEDPANNLYWGAMYGMKTFFKKSSDWELVSTTEDPEPPILEQCTFRHRTSGIMLTASAYRGSRIKEATLDFLADAGSGDGGVAVYIGHNGLMDFTIPANAVEGKARGTGAIILACKSKPYFMPWLERLGAKPVLLTNGLMAPEAYTLEAVLEGWIKDEPGAKLKERAATAYDKYQQCGMTGARRLFYSE